MNGQAVPLAFMFVTLLESAQEGTKGALLRQFIQAITHHCPNIMFTLSDKDILEIDGFRIEIPNAKHQLCYWHGIKYIEKRLGENRPPAAYDPRIAHAVFDFVDPTWAPGVTMSWLEDGVHPDDAEISEPPETLKIKINLATLTAEAISIPRVKTSALSKHCCAPLFVLRDGEERTPVWPAPPSLKDVRGDLCEFCPQEHRGPILEKWRLHLHQHPRIPLNDKTGTHLSADEIHERAVRDIYDYCRKYGLAQVWAYLWNRWYTPKQWVLWARASCDAIPRVKTTMMVESLWRQLKRRDLPQFNRPRLDLLTHVVLVNLLPRVRLKTQYVLGLRRDGRPCPLAKWQEALKRDWEDMSKPDALRSMSKELACLKDGRLKAQGKAEILADIAAERERPRGQYHTSMEEMTCSCPAYLISRWLLCKHLIRMVNEKLGNAPLNNLPFFRNLRRNHFPPYYSIQGIHKTPAANTQSSKAGSAGFVARKRMVVVEEDDDEDPSESRPVYEGSSPFCSDDEADDRVFFSSEELAKSREAFNDIMDVAQRQNGVHGKLARIMKRTLADVDKLGGDLGRDKRRRTGARTWKDSNANTLYND
ncbi:hypothetical protein CYLTODRAFT_252877 [Cylindrobasidium torrendii FP15055 ss-10]|uniref:SWIM-type domain-containing protein n=1 Tax=Cylindrobasidium torrendii FP15055 ss-10 TaxID=1314674 RepID=A0A0D7BDS0_9AGAR|nr:hypothetical protein CYLTODRAFT_252877 [Cylindrobasidium torrendii FP15055 ss-10]